MTFYIKNKIKDPAARKIFGGILDESTLMTLYKLSSKGYFEVIHGPIKSGKESTVLLAEDSNNKKIAIKIYAIGAGNFKTMGPYLMGDIRFRGVKNNKRSIIFAWCQKEFKNLQRIKEAGISCPDPIAFLNNVLVMEFLGNGSESYPRLKDVELENPEKTFKEIISDIRKMYKKAKIVHGDLSEYNILFHKKHYIIDFSQAVLLSHPNAKEFLRRDINNICRYFKRMGIDSDQEKIYNDITGE